MATKKPTLNDLPVILARIADSLEQIVGAPLATHNPALPTTTPTPKTELPESTVASAALPVAQLPVAAPTTNEPAQKAQTAPTDPEPAPTAQPAIDRSVLRAWR